ncbi:MAG: tRNA (adenosine(37)-N6)-dimethylallyltransferase MiaA [Lachnospiraceae bacterium]|nr:tRNA (adenosine(37)-N6)-dimethylallyltransferase MiaA [Lachnospiraceae bacterium]
MKDNPLIILAGPTAVGKTKLSIELAKSLNGEIISADSMQVYKGMDIGTAKITKDEMQGIPHHLIDICSPLEDFNVVLFKKLAKEKVKEIQSRGHVPILTGGTGFYIQALLYDIDFTENDDDHTYREELQSYAEKNGALALHDMLCKVDKEAAEKIHPNNVKRVIRALEFYKKSSMKISEHNKEQSMNESPYNFVYIVLTDERSLLYKRIEERIDEMLNAGLVDEVKGLMDNGLSRGLVSMQGLGYKEIAAYLEGEMSLSEATELLKKETRHFAKRQLTWFRREKELYMVNKSDFDHDEKKIFLHVMNIIKNNLDIDNI